MLCMCYIANILHILHICYTIIEFIVRKMKNLSERLLYFIEKELVVSIREFEKKIGVPYTTINRVIKNGSNIGIDKIEKIAKAYPRLNVDWLIIGEGEIYEDATPDKSILIIENLSQTVLKMSESENVRANNESRIISLVEKISSNFTIDFKKLVT